MSKRLHVSCSLRYRRGCTPQTQQVAERIVERLDYTIWARKLFFHHLLSYASLRSMNIPFCRNLGFKLNESPGEAGSGDA